MVNLSGPRALCQIYYHFPFSELPMQDFLLTWISTKIYPSHPSFLYMKLVNNFCVNFPPIERLSVSLGVNCNRVHMVCHCTRISRMTHPEMFLARYIGVMFSKRLPSFGGAINISILNILVLYQSLFHV